MYLLSKVCTIYTEFRLKLNQKKFLISCNMARGNVRTWTTLFNTADVYWQYCYKRVQSFRIHYLFTGQTYTEIYIIFTDVIWAIFGSVKLLLPQY